jgi:hypothetical protein
MVFLRSIKEQMRFNFSASFELLIEEILSIPTEIGMRELARQIFPELRQIFDERYPEVRANLVLQFEQRLLSRHPAGESLETPQ